jgi:hypothetical protein
MLSIRRMAVEDIPASQTLLSQLGYRMEVSEVRRHFDSVARFDDHAVIVAAEDGRVIALCTCMDARRSASHPRRWCRPWW